MIYLNQASTTYPKPEAVIRAVENGLISPPASQYRSSAAEDGANPLPGCRAALAKLFHIPDKERIFFTSGATESMNRIVRGLKLEGKNVLITQAEHNALLRPLYNLVSDLAVSIAKCDGDGTLILEDLERKLSENPAAVFVNHCSNVTGGIAPLKKISRMVHEAGSLLVVDAAQSAGCIPIDVQEMGIDILVFTGHKGLYGPQGTGGFYVKKDVKLRPCVFGGTGRDSRILRMPPDYEEHEAGTQNLHGIGGLLAGVEFVLAQGIEKIGKREHMFLSRMRTAMEEMPHIQLYGRSGGGPALSFNIQGLAPSDAAYILANTYGIVLRSGFHCAPLIHEAIGSASQGTLRVSVSYFNTEREVDVFLDVLRELERCV